MNSITFTPAMRFSAVNTAIIRGIHVEFFTINTALAPGFPKFIISAKADAQFMQAPARIKIVFSTAGLAYPKGKIITNIVHNTQKLQSHECDFALAISLLVAQNYHQANISDCIFIGSLDLDGTVLAVRGILAILESLGKQKKYVFVSSALTEYLLQYSLWEGVTIIPVHSLTQAWDYLCSRVDLVFYALNRSAGINSTEIASLGIKQNEFPSSDLSLQRKQGTSIDIMFSDSVAVNQASASHISVDTNLALSVSDYVHTEAKQQLLWSAVGAHHTFIHGPCGVGKTTLAQGLVHILPLLDADKLLYRDIFRDISLDYHSDVALLADQTHGIGGKLHREYSHEPDLIKPIGKLSYAQVFGGKYPNFEPGYIHLASEGILFLDECTFISSPILEAMRVYLDEQKNISLQHNFPNIINFQLILAANSCACAAAYPQQCLCTIAEKRHYRSRLSYALLDRIDVYISLLPVQSGVKSSMRKMPSTDPEKDANGLHGETNRYEMMRLREKVTEARERSYTRWKIRIPNARVPEHILRECTNLSLSEQEFLHQLIRKYKFSARAYNRILALAWSIADFMECPALNKDHIHLACELR